MAQDIEPDGDAPLDRLESAAPSFPSAAKRLAADQKPRLDFSPVPEQRPPIQLAMADLLLIFTGISVLLAPLTWLRASDYAGLLGFTALGVAYWCLGSEYRWPHLAFWSLVGSYLTAATLAFGQMLSGGINP